MGLGQVKLGASCKHPSNLAETSLKTLYGFALKIIKPVKGFRTDIIGNSPIRTCDGARNGGYGTA